MHEDNWEGLLERARVIIPVLSSFFLLYASFFLVSILFFLSSSRFDFILICSWPSEYRQPSYLSAFSSLHLVFPLRLGFFKNATCAIFSSHHHHASSPTSTHPILSLPDSVTLTSFLPPISSRLSFLTFPNSNCLPFQDGAHRLIQTHLKSSSQPSSGIEGPSAISSPPSGGSGGSNGSRGFTPGSRGSMSPRTSVTTVSFMSCENVMGFIVYMLGNSVNQAISKLTNEKLTKRSVC